MEMRKGNGTKRNTRKKYGKALNSIAKKGQGAIAPCGVQGQRPWWGLGQCPNLNYKLPSKERSILLRTR